MNRLFAPSRGGHVIGEVVAELAEPGARRIACRKQSIASSKDARAEKQRAQVIEGGDKLGTDSLHFAVLALSASSMRAGRFQRHRQVVPALPHKSGSSRIASRKAAIASGMRFMARITEAQVAVIKSRLAVLGNGTADEIRRPGGGQPF